jgi:cytochrome c oxidase subunit 3
MSNHDHPEGVAHHFDTATQQYDSGKLGIWLFLLTEVMFFSVLFVAYTIYRGNYPEVFQYASNYLDTNLGAANTIVLLFSSFTVAWGVRNAQLGQQKLLKINLIITIICAFAFMGIKYTEYSHKYHEGLLWGGAEHSVMKANADDVDSHMKESSHAWNEGAFLVVMASVSGQIRAKELRPGGLRCALLAHRRPGLDLPLPAPLLD